MQNLNFRDINSVLTKRVAHMKNEDTLESLDKEAAIIAEKRKALLAKSRNDALVKVKEQIKIYGFTATELDVELTHKRKKKTTTKVAPPKYQNPDDPTQTWAGSKGPKPAWIKTFLAKKGDLSTLLIKPAATAATTPV
jgi:DNA-binding protein H-NS